MNLFRVACVSITLAFTCFSSAQAISIRHDVPEADYLALAAPYDAVGQLELADGYVGTGTLVSITQILTAAHNVDGDHDGIVMLPEEITFLLGDDVYSPDHVLSVASVDVNPGWALSNGLPQYDLAVLTLTTPFAAITPMSLSQVDPYGMVGTTIGYGGHGTGDVPFENDWDGLRRAAQNMIDVVDGIDVEDGFTIKTDFDSPLTDTSSFGDLTPLALEGTTAGGDSGGPLVVNYLGQDVIVGVLNGGYNPLEPDYSYSEYGDVSIWSTFLDADNVAFLKGHGLLVPEPSTCVLASLMVLALGARRRVVGRG